MPKADRRTKMISEYEKIWRLVDDLRRSFPVILKSEQLSKENGAGDNFDLWLLQPLDGLNPDTLSRFDSAATDSHILITGRRSETLKLGHKGNDIVRLERPDWLTATDLEALADPSKDLDAPLKGPFRRSEDGPMSARQKTATLNLHRAAIQLMKRALMLPACLISRIDSSAVTTTQNLQSASVETILKLNDEYDVSLISKGKVPVAGAPQAELASFRVRTGGPDYLAFLLPAANGIPSPNPLIRLHSECFTGDLLGSLKCDCGVQLQEAIKKIIQDGGGCLLYLPQEGRGIGLAAKLRAYALQDLGYDTVDANIRLGYDSDERDFRPAAQILKALGFTRIRLLTNNPDKVQCLQQEGIQVVERIQHQFPANPFNQSYLETKKTRTGHLLT